MKYRSAFRNNNKETEDVKDKELFLWTHFQDKGILLYNRKTLQLSGLPEDFFFFFLEIKTDS